MCVLVRGAEFEDEVAGREAIRSMNGFELLGRKIKVSMATSDHAPASAVGSAAVMMASPWGAGGMGGMGSPNFQVDPNSMLAAMGYGRPAMPSAIQAAAAAAQASLTAQSVQPPLPPADSAPTPPPLPPVA